MKRSPRYTVKRKKQYTEQICTIKPHLPFKKLPLSHSKKKLSKYSWFTMLC